MRYRILSFATGLGFVVVAFLVGNGPLSGEMDKATLNIVAVVLMSFGAMFLLQSFKED